ncbi:MAG TPA: gliding motility-associated C-terminal domain-containing protein, partial [Nitrosopumilaceae archaeon]|nr:gliding motility-associated C-terminal domain-containing protein [Nitrosopumilaceae archaeon]
ASSVFLKATGLAKRMQLDMIAQTPWVNYTYFIYRQNSVGTNYIFIDSTHLSTYIDTNLANGKTYCYKVKAIGQYSNSTIYHPLYNWSQKVCAAPIDKEAPCAPTINVSGDCVTQITQMTWNNPNKSCCKDASYYTLYFTPVKDSTMIKINSFPINTTSFQTDYASSIAGCYAITATDSSGNESVKGAVSCVDNCPEYELPNIFTPNGDSINDYFIPVKNRFVKDIDLKIYNRWGELMFQTTNPAIHWDGKSMQSKLPGSDGTYFYVCDVHTIHYTGIVTLKLKGFIQTLKN